MTSDTGSFRSRARAEQRTGAGAPSDLTVFAEELSRVDLRVAAVIAAGRANFFEGSESYDRASMAIIRLAALFENEKRFGTFLASATEVERQGIAYVRGIVSDPGQAGMDDDIFWATITRQVPKFIEKLREANGL